MFGSPAGASVIGRACGDIPPDYLAKVGLEPPAPAPFDHSVFAKPAHSAGAESGAAAGGPPAPAAVPPDLARVVEAWPALPEPLRRAVLALIGAA